MYTVRLPSFGRSPLVYRSSAVIRSNTSCISVVCRHSVDRAPQCGAPTAVAAAFAFWLRLLLKILTYFDSNKFLNFISLTAQQYIRISNDIVQIFSSDFSLAIKEVDDSIEIDKDRIEFSCARNILHFFTIVTALTRVRLRINVQTALHSIANLFMINLIFVSYSVSNINNYNSSNLDSKDAVGACHFSLWMDRRRVREKSHCYMIPNSGKYDVFIIIILKSERENGSWLEESECIVSVQRPQLQQA